MTSARYKLLDDVRVLDVSQFVPGPFATLLLSDLGADVVKVEPPFGDPQTSDGPIDEDGISSWYKVVNRNKRIITLDLKDDIGKQQFEVLLSSADVLLESYRPGVLEKLGFARTRIETINPRLIHCALSGWGQTGPYRLRPGHDNNYQAMAGILDISGTADMPIAANPPIADFAGAQISASLICAALFSRSRNGCGSYIDVSMADAAMSVLGTDIAALHHPHFQTKRGVGPYAGGWACYQTYQASCGGYLTLGALEPRFWANFCHLVGRSEWIDRQRERRPQLALISELAMLFASRPLIHWTDLLDEAEACFHEVVTLEDLGSNRQVTHRQMLRSGDDGLTDVLLPAWIDGTPPPPRRAHLRSTAPIICEDWRRGRATAST